MPASKGEQFEDVSEHSLQSVAWFLVTGMAHQAGLGRHRPLRECDQTASVCAWWPLLNYRGRHLQVGRHDSYEDGNSCIYQIRS